MSRKLEIRNRKAREAARRHAKSHGLFTLLDVTRIAWRALLIAVFVLGTILSLGYWLAWRFDFGGF